MNVQEAPPPVAPPQQPQDPPQPQPQEPAAAPPPQQPAADPAPPPQQPQEPAADPAPPPQQPQEPAAAPPPQQPADPAPPQQPQDPPQPQPQEPAADPAPPQQPQEPAAAPPPQEPAADPAPPQQPQDPPQPQPQEPAAAPPPQQPAADPAPPQQPQEPATDPAPPPQQLQEPAADPAPPPQQPAADPAPPQQPQEPPKKPFSFSVSKKNSQYQNNRICLSTGKAVSDDDEERKKYHTPKIGNVEKQAIEKTQDAVSKCEMYIESLKSVSSRCQANTVELTKSVASIKERITEKGNSVCNTIKSQSEELMNIVEKESERIKEEYLKSATASADLEKDVVTLMDQAKAERNALENREKNGDIAMETILAILKKIDDLKNKVESVKMGSSFSHKVLIVDGGYPKIAFFGESSVLLNLLLGEEYLATSSKEQEGEHRQLAYIPSDVFELRCQKENHRNFEYLRLNEKDKAWSCDRCKVDGTVDYDDIKDKK